MKTCKYPKCNKVLVGKEKYICKSCSDKIKDNAKKAGTITVSLAVAAVAILSKVKNSDGDA